MIILKRINTTLIEKTIQPGATEEFFIINLGKYEAFDWNIKTFMPNTGIRGIVKISSLYTGIDIESTTYSLLGNRFNTKVGISMSTDDNCVFTITNNESSFIQCSVKLKIF